MKPVNKKVCIVLVNWKGYNDTIECIDSLSKMTFTDYDIILVDNSPDDNDYNKFISELKNVRVIKSDNRGFAAGNNTALKIIIQENFKYGLLLNNDTIVEPDFLEKLVCAADKENAGISTPKINYYPDKNTIWAAGGKLSFIAGSAYMHNTGKPDSSSTESSFVDFISGCCMLINTELLRKVGLMDEEYFLYMEDADLCKRTLNAGFKMYYAADSKIYHKVNATSKNNMEVPLYYMTRNRLYYSKKFYPKGLPLVKSYIYITMFLKSVLWSLNGNSENIRTVRAAISDFNNNKMGIH